MNDLIRLVQSDEASVAIWEEKKRSRGRIALCGLHDMWKVSRMNESDYG